MGNPFKGAASREVAGTRIQPSATVIPSYQGEQAVLLDYERGEYFGLNPVATSMWRALAEGKSFDEVVATIRDEYDADPATIRQDQQLLADLHDRRMIEPLGEPK
jgi:hypothetical protein